MQVRITVTGEPDTLPFTKTFQFQGYDDEVFIASLNKVKDNLEQNLPVNINETLLLFAAYVVSSIKEGKSEKEIRDKAKILLSHNQVMIGVPEMLCRLDFDVRINDLSAQVSINRPIQVPDYPNLTN